MDNKSHQEPPSLETKNGPHLHARYVTKKKKHTTYLTKLIKFKTKIRKKNLSQ